MKFNYRQSAIALLVMTAILVPIVMINSGDAKQKVVSDPEKQFNTTVVLDDKNETFYKSVTRKDYKAVIGAVSEYVQSYNKDPGGVTVRIYNITTPIREGSVVSFKVDIEELDQYGLRANYDFLQQPNIMLNIEEKDFSTILYYE